MASPQPDQYTKISNELMEAIPRFKFNGTQLRLLFVILRYTYGYNRKEWDISLTFLSNSTGVNRTQVKQELKTLIGYKVIKVIKEATFNSTRILAFNKDYDEWLLPRGEIDTLGSKSYPGYENKYTPGGQKHPTPAEKNSMENTGEPSNGGEIEGEGSKSYPGGQKRPQLKKKDLKENIKENIYTVFAHWNSKKIIEHRELTKKIEGHINARLDKYTVAEICEAINNYDTVLKGDDYFFSYKWTLAEFLTRDGGLPKFMAESDPLNNYRKNKGPPKDQKIPRGFASIREAVERSKNIEH